MDWSKGVMVNVPFRHWVVSDFVKPLALADLPPSTDPFWEVGYNNDCEYGKRTSRQDGFLSSRFQSSLCSRLAGIFGYPLEPDPLLWGAGLHVTEPGGWLNPHLDFDRHPKIPTHRRAVSVVVFLNSVWKKEWGGALCFYNPAGDAITRYYPRPGLMIAFENSDISYHGVEKVERCGMERVTSTCYYLAPAGPQNTRTRALFFPNRGPK